MTKNVNVVDELGNRYVPTYAKRAKGLVKNGRARWVDENTICLACPPDDIDLEDTKMENKINPIENIPVESTEQKDDFKKVVLDRIDRIIAQGDELMKVVEYIQMLPVNDCPNGGHDGQARAEAIGNIYASREQTNQKMINMLDKMYNDMMAKPENQPSSESVMDAIRKMDFAGMTPETAKIVIDAMMGMTNT